MNRSFSPAACVAILLIALMIGLSGCGGPVDLSGLTSTELYDRGMEEYEKEKYLRSIEYLQTLVYNYPGESVIDTAQYYLAMSYYGNDDFTLAAVEFNRLLVNYPSSAFAPQAQLMRAVCYYEGTPQHYGLDQTDLNQAIRQFEDFLIDYPESEAVALAQVYLDSARTRLAHKSYESGVVYTRIRDFSAAKTYYQLVIDEHTESKYAALAAYQIAEGYFQQKKWDSAHEAFQSFAIVYSEHEDRGKALKRSCQSAYKGGKEAYDAGDYALARQRFERHQIACGESAVKAEEVLEILQKLPALPVADSADTSDAGT